MEVLAPMIGVVGIVVALGWIVQILTTSRQRLKLAALQAEMQEKLLDKFGTSEELIHYLESDAGRQVLDAATFESASPYKRILRSVQAGLILTLTGVAFLILRGPMKEAEDAFVFLGALGLALGLGFLLSAAATLVLSRSWGLLDEKSEEED